MTTIYYAHPISLYNTTQEQRDMNTLHTLGFTVINPNQPVHQEEYNEWGMEYFEKLIKTHADGLVFRAFPDGSISAGVAQEIAIAEKCLYPIIELPVAIARRTLNVKETKDTLLECGYR